CVRPGIGGIVSPRRTVPGEARYGCARMFPRNSCGSSHAGPLPAPDKAADATCISAADGCKRQFVVADRPVICGARSVRITPPAAFGEFLAELVEDDLAGHRDSRRCGGVVIEEDEAAPGGVALRVDELPGGRIADPALPERD